jgi:S-adenosylmethionine:tRNA ribosyltransferase-isomerase
MSLTPASTDKPASPLHQVETYDYDLPPELIAQEPLGDRTAARLLVVDRARGTFEHRHVRDLPALLAPGDALVLNDTRVVPARLVGFRTTTGGKWEGLFLAREPAGTWQVIGQTRGRLLAGETVSILANDNTSLPLLLKLVDRLDGGVWRIRPLVDGEPWALLEQYGRVPLPPYIRHGEARREDLERYQTTYAARPGSAAAPTAGLHFTSELLAACRERGVVTTEVTLHVGLGTFRPVNVSDIREHSMHAEWCELPATTAEALRDVKERGSRIVAVGTTSLRTLETAVPINGWNAWQGESRLFVYPPYEFRAVDALLTNFHLPKSTLLMLVSAFAGVELTRAAYRAAIAEGYRFFSYGDAMLVV